MSTTPQKLTAEERRRQFHDARQKEMGQSAYQEALRRAAEARTRLENYNARQDKEVEKAARKKGKRLPGPPRPDVDTRLAIIAREIEPILEKNARVIETYRYVTVVDAMAARERTKPGDERSRKLITVELARAAERFRELYEIASGKSQGVSSYGEFQPGSEPSKRMVTTDKMMKARKELEKAIEAVFAVKTCDGDSVVDRELWRLVYPALIYDGKDVSQGQIGRERIGYEGRAQYNAAGGSVIIEVLKRLSLHFKYRVE